jgi:osmoprotectant transport system ATP-binding protein
VATFGPVITFERVSFARGAVPVLHDVSLTIDAGETVALVGKSGAGKSTLLKLVNRMLRPHQGRVIVDGRATDDWDPFELRRHTGYVLQEVALFPHMTVFDNVAVVPRLAGWPAERIDARVREVLALVDLGDAKWARRAPAELSGGQRQRVGVARALAADPPILLMDEPFGALDPITRGELHHQLLRIQQQLRKTIVLVTHDMGEAFALGTRIGVISNGALIACDAPARIARSAHPEIRAMLAPLVEASEALASARGGGSERP